MVRIGDVVPAVVENSPVIGSVYGFGKAAFRVYDAQTPAAAMYAAVKGVLIDCAPPDIKYPLLCGYLLTSGVVTYFTGGPIATGNMINAARLIVEQVENV